MNNIYISMIMGMISTVMLHLGKCMQRQGIEILPVVKRRLLHKEKTSLFSHPDNIKKLTIYVAGLILNNSVVFMVMISNMYAPVSYFTSMFGLGIIALMIYSRIVLKESIGIKEYIGSIILVAGTVLMGLKEVSRDSLNMSHINITSVIAVSGIFFICVILFMIFSYRKNDPFLIGLSFGIYCGGGASLDPVLKNIGQTYIGQMGFFPQSLEGWIIFMSSFVVATSTFLAAQWGFIKKAEASVLVPMFSSVYVVFPIIIQGIALPRFHITGMNICTLAMIVSGIFILQGYRKNIAI